ncbi:MAG: hypothetical protein PCFJNLEI_01060 [Verrucomicrobiae bacterium]|nr:hypothetical protein [Verrucomicrobiae bacterium]
MSNLSVTWRRTAIAATVASFVIASSAVRAEDAEKPWERTIAVGISMVTGNTDSSLFNAAVKGEKIWKADELRLGASGAYGKNDGDVATEVLLGFAQYKHLFSERWYGALTADAIHDSIANVEYRLTIGPALGYFLIKKEMTRWTIEAGPSYVYEKTDVRHPNQPPGPTFVTSDDRGYLAARFSERIEHKFSGNNAKVWQQTDWLPQVDDFQNYLLISEAGIEAALTKAMSLRVVGTHRYDNRTDSQRHYDITLVSALAYKF